MYVCGGSKSSNMVPALLKIIRCSLPTYPSTLKKIFQGNSQCFPSLKTIWGCVCVRERNRYIIFLTCTSVLQNVIFVCWGGKLKMHCHFNVLQVCAYVCTCVYKREIFQIYFMFKFSIQPQKYLIARSPTWFYLRSALALLNIVFPWWLKFWKHRIFV